MIWEEWEGESGKVALLHPDHVPANALISKITDRMPAILRPEDWPVWLGEVDAPFTQIKALLQTFDDEGNWEMREQSAAKPAEGAEGRIRRWICSDRVLRALDDSEKIFSRDRRLRACDSGNSSFSFTRQESHSRDHLTAESDRLGRHANDSGAQNAHRQDADAERRNACP